MKHLRRILSVLALGLMAALPSPLPASEAAATRQEQAGWQHAADRITSLLQRLKKAQDPIQRKALSDALLKAWASRGPASAQALLKQAEHAQAAGLLEVAERQLRLVVKRWPEYEEGRLRHAFFLWQMGQDEAALRELDAILARNPDYFPAHLLKIRIAMAGEQLQKAVRACDMLLKRFPHWKEAEGRCRRLRLQFQRDA